MAYVVRPDLNLGEFDDLLTMASASERYRKALEKIIESRDGSACPSCDSVEQAWKALEEEWS